MRTFGTGPGLVGAGASEVIDALVHAGIVISSQSRDLADTILEACKAIAAADRDTVRRARSIRVGERSIWIIARSLREGTDIEEKGRGDSCKTQLSLHFQKAEYWAPGATKNAQTANKRGVQQRSGGREETRRWVW